MTSERNGNDAHSFDYLLLGVQSYTWLLPSNFLKTRTKCPSTPLHKKTSYFFFFCSICSKIPINDLWPTFQNTQIEEVLAVDCREVDSGTGKGYSQYKAREAFLYCMIETPNLVATKSGKSATIAMKQKLPWSMTTFHKAAAKLSLGCASHTSCTKFPRGQAELPQVTLTCQSRCLKTVSISYKMKNPITII